MPFNATWGRVHECMNCNICARVVRMSPFERHHMQLLDTMKEYLMLVCVSVIVLLWCKLFGWRVVCVPSDMYTYS